MKSWLLMCSASQSATRSATSGSVLPMLSFKARTQPPIGCAKSVFSLHRLVCNSTSGVSASSQSVAHSRCLRHSVICLTHVVLQGPYTTSNWLSKVCLKLAQVGLQQHMRCECQFTMCGTQSGLHTTGRACTQFSTGWQRLPSACTD